MYVWRHFEMWMVRDMNLFSFNPRSPYMYLTLHCLVHWHDMGMHGRYLVQVKGSNLDTNMEDPLTASHRTLLRAGQMLTDYVKGAGSSRHMFLSPDCQFLMLKDTSNKVARPGRKVPLKNLLSVTRGYGPGHYKSALLGGERRVQCLYRWKCE